METPRCAKPGPMLSSRREGAPRELRTTGVPQFFQDKSPRRYAPFGGSNPDSMNSCSETTLAPMERFSLSNTRQAKAIGIPAAFLQSGHFPAGFPPAPNGVLHSKSARGRGRRRRLPCKLLQAAVDRDRKTSLEPSPLDHFSPILIDISGGSRTTAQTGSSLARSGGP